ncbi:hypothetical protein BJ875DRAFT_380267 [Amylocarpus encephaloides]|uniref:Nudix hydrolase domain-containing protein n=1 Tax=Amylocarpus encephaloides TaxID=45428 RepID=A0A9P8C3J6_9HELO|nr:hypothetical protein BJ875DRAFT_380267 [Amylocarpus encephaloides]
MSSDLRERSVVSSFICTSPQSLNGFTFALFKRSQEVSTYPGKWAVCSGSIDVSDVSPESAAKREIFEETTLSDKDLSLLRRGKPFSLIDEELKTKWTIHPFAWQLKENAKPIQFDWEHTEYKFIRPDELRDYDHVPQLDLGLRRTMVGPETERALNALANDHESGAQGLTIKALRLLVDFVSDSPVFLQADSAAEVWSKVRWISWHLAKNGRPSMGAAIEASVFQCLARIKDDMERAAARGMQDSSPDGIRQALRFSFLARIQGLQNQMQDIAFNFVRYFQQSPCWARQTPKIVTLSASGTTSESLIQLIRAFSNAQSRRLKLVVLESRPNFEGVIFVNNLLSNLKEAASSVEIEIMSDASVALAVQDADFLMLGADKVHPNGSISNKVGSQTAAIVAKALSPYCSIVASFDTSKIIYPGVDLDYAKVEYNDPEEIMDAWPKSAAEDVRAYQWKGDCVEVTNPYFEWVPRNYIDAYITELGELQQQDLEGTSLTRIRNEEAVFKDL